MAGQFKTRRNPDTGQLEKIPAEEAAELQAVAEPGALTQADLDFMERATGEVSAPALLPEAVQPSPAVAGKAPTPVAPPVQAAVRADDPGWADLNAEVHRRNRADDNGLFDYGPSQEQFSRRHKG